jgi:hypothetical protein
LVPSLAGEPFTIVVLDLDASTDFCCPQLFIMYFEAMLIATGCRGQIARNEEIAAVF